MANLLRPLYGPPRPERSVPAPRYGTGAPMIAGTSRMSPTASTGSAAIRTSRGSRGGSNRPAEKKEYAPRGQPPDRAQDLQHAGLPRGRSLRAVRQRADGRGRLECRRPLRALRRGSARLRAVRELRHRRRVRVPEADPGPRLAQGRAQQCTLFEPRTTVERETKSVAPTSARKAFDDLFK